MIALLVGFATFTAAFLIYRLCHCLLFSPLRRVPGPTSFALTGARLSFEDYRGTRTRKIFSLHQKYGPVVRVGPNEISFNSLSSLRAIYGAGSGFERTEFYKMFEAYGRKNLFSFSSVKEHGDRKKLFAHAYAKSVMLKGENAAMVERKAKLYTDLLGDEDSVNEIFASLHYYSLDNITEFLYGRFGKTSCLEGSQQDRELIIDIVDTARRKLSWYSVHFPGFTKWLYSRSGALSCIAQHFYPMKKPTTYTGIRLHAAKACQAFAQVPESEKLEETSLIAKLWRHHHSQKENGMDDLDIASECADHLLAGIDTTSDTLMFLIWSLSRPPHSTFQDRLVEEVQKLSEKQLDADGIPMALECDKLPYLDAVIKEALRLYAPLPGSEPRSLSKAVTIDGFLIPPHTTVSIAPYTLHRNPEIFKDPLNFNPDRWLEFSEESMEMKKWFWAFSSGGRMCIGMHLAMTEMTTLVAAVYRKYRTKTTPAFDNVSPGITARYEVFYDEMCPGMRVCLNLSSQIRLKA
ncbi:hypothetical protein N7462_001420 [Penicillium macrosclerotiorum]|uniref:uncharacterized protein n=1 Tax=Penicillium macrosclerotiorum TaxID=303699 RepID=UPI002549803B|nr:uncharacterized protein N7462_001420 [Penicillium macrosclerotiorum]KAJ5691997.1 hypothetical protein N7462_001420 [Penicillium macrosclerotiorum]